MATTRLTRHLDAPRDAVYAALVDPAAVEQWMVPDGMTSRVHAWDARAGGTFRISLTYDENTGTGKTTSSTDSFQGRFARLVEGQQVVQVVEFESPDPTIRGEMKITMTLTDEDGGTRLDALHEDLPEALSPEENELGWNMSLDKLTALVERR